MELRHLKSFLAVAETLNFGRAAERLHLSQPALSLQIRSLEDAIGVRLFERNRRRTALTAAGILFREDATDVLTRVERAMHHARLAASGKVGSLRIGFISTAAREIVPSIVREFRDAHEEVELSLRNILTMDQVRLLEAGTLDIGFLRLPVEGHPELDVVTVHKEPFVLVLPSSHRLAKRTELRLRDVASEKFVMYRRDDAPGFHDLTLKILRDANIIPRISQVAGEMHTLVSLVAAEMGIAVLPESAVRRGIAGVKGCKIKDAIPLSTIGLASHKQNQDPVTRIFRTFALRLLKCS
jgi:DNA-binding transcriptional LysR family regulator